ncbi:D-arabinono-1,4-lactone oxidase [Promicromonospora panici]|uniref:D-arabinono-1,4-lactone oxidase n=1 Tax=Promicromonospora panici TaxID=2219658 RepID=UPI00101DDD21|nr:D-arabinono-1,4-lactone oxidase [Promicromonospora panici]
MKNWAANLTYSSARVERPRTLAELAGIVAGEPRVRALGSRHSFGDVADTTGVHVQVDLLDDGRPALEVHPGTGVASVRAGLRYGEVAADLHARGRALTAMASLPHISVAGAVATGTHGSGDGTRSLAGDVVGVELMTAAGELLILRRGDADFPGSVVALGALGVVTRVELSTVRTFDVRQDVFTGLPWEALFDNLDAVMSSAYSVSVFTSWHEPDVRLVWCKSKVSAGSGGAAPALPVELGAVPATRPMHPLPDVAAVACTEQGGVPGPWFERLPHFRLDFTPSLGEELQSEYLLPRAAGPDAVRAVRALGDRIGPLLLTSEIRTIAGDEQWLSTTPEDSLAFHFTWKQDWPAVRAALPELEAVLLPLGARPHWGKLFTVPVADLPGLYPRFGDFAELAARLDPAGKFRGGYVHKLLTEGN